MTHSTSPAIPASPYPRREPREETVCVVEYAAYPRTALDRRSRFGFTRDISRSGMCIGVDDAAPVGALLRVTVRGADGRPARSAIERVVWCSAERDGRYWMGLQLLCEAKPPGPAAPSF